MLNNRLSDCQLKWLTHEEESTAIILEAMRSSTEIGICATVHCAPFFSANSSQNERVVYLSPTRISLKPIIKCIRARIRL